MFRVTTLAAFVAASMLIVAPVAQAAEPTIATEHYQGNLGEGCYRMNDGSFCEVYQLNIQAGSYYTVDLYTGDFQPRIWVQDDAQPNAAHAMVIDSNGQQHAQVCVYSAEDTTVYLVVNALAAGQSGDYVLQLTAF